MPPHFELQLGFCIGCERRCNACGLKYLIALYCGWMRRVLKIFTNKPHTHNSYTSHIYTHTQCSQLWPGQTAVHPVEAEVSECLRFSHHSRSFSFILSLSRSLSLFLFQSKPSATKISMYWIHTYLYTMLPESLWLHYLTIFPTIFLKEEICNSKILPQINII